MDGAGLTHPPRARLAFRVGVVGHRPDRLPADEGELSGLRARLGFVLAEVRRSVAAALGGEGKALYRAEPPLLTAISPLAEGSDRLFAVAALDLGYALTAPMPFARHEYARDFGGAYAPGAAEFDELLTRAAQGPGLAVFELDGSRAEPGAAYGAAGRVVVNQSDLLIAVWDGGPARGRGGTLETVARALGSGVPVLWICPRAPHAWSALRSEDDLASLETEGVSSPIWPHVLDRAGDEAALAQTIAAVVAAEVGPPQGHEDETAATSLLSYFGERRRRFNPFLPWRVFRDFAGGGGVRLPKLTVGDYVAEVASEWPVAGEAPAERGAAPAGAAVAQVNAALRPHFAFADKLADFYADAHRSDFVAASLLAAAAVFAALLPVAVGASFAHPTRLELALIASEALILGLLMSTVAAARRGRWHERWLEYRMLAEWIRQLRFLIPLGGARPLPRSPAHLAVWGEPTMSWMYWQVRAIARETGIPSAACNRAYAAECLAYLTRVLGDDGHGQIGFHRRTTRRSETIQRRIRGTVQVLLWVTIAAVAARMAVTLVSAQAQALAITAGLAGVLIVIAGGFPALSAGLANIDNQGEFVHMAKRSRAMAEALGRLKAEADALQRRVDRGEHVRAVELISLASRLSQVMVEEGVDWRVLALEAPRGPD
ncbi:MAG TPA: hypothetical protein VGS12_08400 [Caulobacteraceae bacterium]|nr:hypothetical protein [Caulobacteraceae bacterium]